MQTKAILGKQCTGISVLVGIYTNSESWQSLELLLSAAVVCVENLVARSVQVQIRSLKLHGCRCVCCV